MIKSIKFQNLFLLFVATFLFVACVNNDKKDSGGGDEDEDEKELTEENIEQGDWEIAYFTHRVKTSGIDVTARGYSLDGFTVNFYDGESYMEYNTLGDKTVIKGLYALGEDGKSITLDYTYKAVETGKIKDSTVTINVSKLTDKTMIYTNEMILKEGNSFIQDVFYLRHKEKGTNEFTNFGEKKKLLEPTKLAGSWKIHKITASTLGTTSTGWVIDKHITDSLKQLYMDSKFVYNINTEPYSYEQYGRADTIIQKGIFTINDDILHLYYDRIKDDGTVIDVMSSMAVDMAADGKSFVHSSKEYSYSINQTEIKRVETEFIREQ